MGNLTILRCLYMEILMGKQLQHFGVSPYTGGEIIYIFDDFEAARLFFFQEGWRENGLEQLFIAKYTYLEYKEKKQYSDITMRKHEFEILLPENEGGRKLIKYK